MKKTGRDKKIAEEIRREAALILGFELSDPVLFGLVVTTVRMTADLKLARVYYALPGRESEKKQVQQTLKKASGYVRGLLSERIHMKYIPQVEFFYDESLEIEAKIKEIFQEVPPTGESDTENDEHGQDFQA